MEIKMVIKVPEHQDEWDNMAEKGWGGGGGLNTQRWVGGN